ncbi:MAG: hypothetical protein CBC29_07280 [Methylococcaceae bacterium TMED69]|nr:MAG: hypothetical protein CBC29_05455 [Methylococcaceae bacterium TMED69]OUU74922.1 MAG: hypothetical protein CBC29_07280 [Methylococcaceae bacterium TMED69]
MSKIISESNLRHLIRILILEQLDSETGCTMGSCATDEGDEEEEDLLLEPDESNEKYRSKEEASVTGSWFNSGPAKPESSWSHPVCELDEMNAVASVGLGGPQTPLGTGPDGGKGMPAPYDPENPKNKKTRKKRTKRKK